MLPPTTKPTLSEEDGGTIAMAGMFIGGGFGVLLVIGAFIDPTFEGRVYIFGTPVILGLLGHWAGFGIEKVIRLVRRKF